MRDAKVVLDKVDELAIRSGSAPSPKGYGAVLNAYVARNLPSEAFAVLQRFRRMGGVPDERMYNSVARMCVRNRDWGRALQVVQAMEARGQEADKGMLVRMITSLESSMQVEEDEDEEAWPGSIPGKQQVPVHERESDISVDAYLAFLNTNAHPLPPLPSWGCFCSRTPSRCGGGNRLTQVLRDSSFGWVSPIRITTTPENGTETGKMTLKAICALLFGCPGHVSVLIDIAK